MHLRPPRVNIWQLSMVSEKFESRVLSFFFQDIGDDFGDEDYGGGRRKGGKRTRMPRQSMGGGPRKTRKSRAKPVSIDDDYDQVEPTHFCGLCGKVSRLFGC